MGGTGQLQIHTSNRQEVLLRHLAGRMRAEPLAPLQNETVLVPGRAMARWLRLQLARELGISGSLDLPFPGTFLARLCGAGDRDPFAREVLAMRIFRVLGDGAADRQLAQPVRYCRDDADQRKRFQLSQRLAACFDAYQLWRDDLLLGFARGDAEAAAVHPHAAFQAHLWRLLLAECSALPEPRAGERQPARRLVAGTLPFAEPQQPHGEPVHPHRLQRARELLADAAHARAVLPERLHVFGIASLPPAVVALLHQIAAHRPVTLYLLLPTDRYFGDLARARGDAAAEPGLELLARLSRQAREFVDVLLDADVRGQGLEPLEFVDPAPEHSRGSALAALQSDLLHLDSRAPAERFPLQAGDASLRVHGCHSPLREMEVVRDQVLDALEHEPGLRPHDVMVLVPDIRTYSPYVQAVFGPLAGRLPFQIADRSPQARAPMLASLLRVLELAQTRLTTPDVLHLLTEPALLRRFALTPADLPALRDFLERTRVRLWPAATAGAETGEAAGPADPHTFGLARQRLLFGVAAGAEERLVHGLLPEADATDARAETLGRLCDLCEMLQERLRVLGRPQPVAEWARQLELTLERAFAPEEREETDAAEQLRACVQKLRMLAEVAGLREEWSPAVLREWLDEYLHTLGDGSGLFTGGVTFAALKPMRAVPVAVLCIAGLSAAAFPRRGRPQAFDLIAACKRRGDRSVRGDDRHLFLEALLSARRRLHLTYVARSQKDNSECAPSAVLSELLEHLDRSCIGPGGRPAREWLFVQHPLQAFSERYRDGSDGRLYTYELHAQAAAAAAAGTIFVPQPLPVLPRERVELALEQLVSFWRNPARAFCRHTLDLSLRRPAERDDDCEPFALHALQEYQLRQATALARMQGEAVGDAMVLATQRGLLPTQGLGPLAYAQLDVETAVLAARLGAPAQSHEVTFATADFVLRGKVPMQPDGSGIQWRAATVKAKDRLVAWLHHLLLHAGGGAPTTTAIHGLEGQYQLEPITSAENARTWLTELTTGMQQGLSAPLPFFERASWEWQKPRTARDATSAMREARKAYLPGQLIEGRRLPGDSEDPHVALCWRDQDPLALPGFAEWAERVYRPLIHHWREREG